MASLKSLGIRRKSGLTLYRTSYATGSGFYSAEIEALDDDHAVLLTTARGLGERIEGPASCSWTGQIARQIDEGSFLAAAHEACFLCFIGMASGAISFREALGDQGLVHELLHLANGDLHETKKRARRCKAMAEEFANRIPGYPVHEWKLEA